MRERHVRDGRGLHVIRDVDRHSHMEMDVEIDSPSGGWLAYNLSLLCFL